MQTTIERFMKFVQPITESGCWIWMGSVSKFGHGHFKFLGMAHKAHRISYRLFIGDIPEGMVVRHKCDVPYCVNPAHLMLGTQAENVRDTSMRNRLNPKSLLNLLRKNRDRRANGDIKWQA